MVCDPLLPVLILLDRANVQESLDLSDSRTPTAVGDRELRNLVQSRERDAEVAVDMFEDLVAETASIMVHTEHAGMSVQVH